MNAPLSGVRVVVTRAADQAGDLDKALSELGAEVVLAPMIVIAEPSTWAPLDGALGRLHEYEWVMFTSANAASMLLARMRDPTALAQTRVAAVGSTTRRLLEERGVRVDLVPHDFTGRSLAAALGAGSGPVLLPRVAGAPRDLVEALTAAGWRVDEVVAYRNLPPDPSAPWVAALRTAAFDAVTFASPSAVRNFAGLGLDAGTASIVCIGPSTAAAAKELGLFPDAVASDHTTAGLVAALIPLFAGNGTIGK